MATANGRTTSFSRGTGLLIIEVRHSNPNGDPDAESDPRTIDADGRGLISPVSFKRKVRDLIAAADGPVWRSAVEALKLDSDAERKFGILESRGRKRAEIGRMSAEQFVAAYWDGRVFGNTFLEDAKSEAPAASGGDGDLPADGSAKRKASKAGSGDESGRSSKDHFISTGVVQFGAGVSIAPIDVERLTTTNKSGVQEGKDRGMAPLGWRVVRHGVYAMPFFVNPMMATKTGCDARDIDVLKFLIPHAYRNTASAIRPFVEVRHAWYAEHKSSLGSCPDSIILDELTPRKTRGDDETPSTSVSDYDIPTDLSPSVRGRLAAFDDLCAMNWN